MSKCVECEKEKDTFKLDVGADVCVVCRWESGKGLDEDGWCPSCIDKQKNSPLSLYLHDMDRYIEHEKKYL